ncbi:MAG: 2OG-Fe(II) oxygenase [Vicinamibacterales bacterium]
MPGPAPPPDRLLCAGRGGWRVSADAATRAASRAAFARDRLLWLPGFFDEGLLGVVRRRLTAERFRERVVRGLRAQTAELSLEDDVTLGLLHFLLNDPDVLSLVREVSAVPAIRRFVGGVYRLMPGPTHACAWHDDVDGNRLVALTLNLGEEVFEGGELEVRRKGEPRLLARMANTGPGDAVLFPLEPALEHRIAPMAGRVPKTALAGWFVRDPGARG